MSLTIAQARDEMFTLVRTAWVANSGGVPLRFWDTKDVIPGPSNSSWADLRAQWTIGNQNGFGLSLRKYTREGILTLRVFTPFGDGLTENDSLTQVALNALEGVDTANGVWFRRVRVNHIGQDGEWFQTNILADFFYEEVK